LACSWKCKIAEGESGICGARWNRKGKLYLMAYGKVYNGLSLDPVEKKPLFHFLPGSSVLSFGTVGCNFGCLFCQNSHMSQSPKAIKTGRHMGRPLRNKEARLLELVERTSEDWRPKEIVEEALKVKASAIAYTYNEPAVFAEYAHDTMKLARKKGLKNIFVSNGFESPETLKLVGPYLDAINVDLKSFSDKFYREVCKGKIEAVLKNIKKLYKMGVWLEITTLIIPTLNDSEKELKQIAKFIKEIDREIPWHVSAFHPAYKLQHLPPTPREKVIKAYETGKKVGLSYVYVGNIWGERDYSSTFCPKCGALLIRREIEIVIENLNEKKGVCKKCGYKIKGVFAS